ncbi:MAG: SMC-Scp complex subunit ScpB [Candidatus Dadabacteria bacterium]|nr:MAG: SMC-Scp complex subunit ScpB [Candidatus Dadabacteria bacterium]
MSDNKSGQELNENPEEGQEQLDKKLALVEALLFAYGEPLDPADLKSAAGLEDKELKEVIEELKNRYSSIDRGIELKVISGRYQLRTKPQFASAIGQLKAGRPRRLSPAALETLAIIAYRQPIVRSDIEKLRGVDATPTIKTLLDKKLIKIVGHQATVGQPALYGTTDEFLKLFGISSLSELPTLRDLKELEEDPGEFPEESEGAESDKNEDQQKAQGSQEEACQDAVLVSDENEADGRALTDQAANQ